MDLERFVCLLVLQRNVRGKAQTRRPGGWFRGERRHFGGFQPLAPELFAQNDAPTSESLFSENGSWGRWNIAVLTGERSSERGHRSLSRG